MDLLHTLTAGQFAIIAGIGLAAGVLGGMLGVGGSVVTIPALTLALGPDQHLYQAAAMISNVVVSVPAALRHRQAGAVVGRALAWLMPAAVVGILLGVAISNLPIFAGPTGGLWLGRVLAAFLVYVIGLNVKRLLLGRRRTPTPPPAAAETPPAPDASPDDPDRPAITPARGLSVGGIMGLLAGIMGIGGGSVAVPLQQTIMRMPLRPAIANSSVIICFSAVAGAVYKNLTLPQHHHAVSSGLIVAALLAPTAILGARFGAGLTHRLPVRVVRAAFIALLIAGAWEMAQLT